MHLLGQNFLRLLRHCLLRYLGDYTVARSMALGTSNAGVVDDVGYFLLNFLGELLLELFGHDAAADGVGSVGSFRHDDEVLMGSSEMYLFFCS